MSDLNIPDTAQELKNRNRADIQNQIPESDPFVETNWVTALSDSNANRQFDFFLQILILKKQMFWDTLTGESLDRWANIWVGPRNAATQSTGPIAAIGTLSSVINAGETLTSADGQTYTTDAVETITATAITPVSITNVGTTATVTLPTASSFLANNLTVVVTGANEAQYNVTDASISVINDTSFQYTLPSDPGGDATGTLLVEFEFAEIAVTSDISESLAQDVNQSAFTELTFTTPIAGVDNNVQVTISELGGATDLESDDDYRDRMLERVRGFLAFFSVDTIKVFIRDNVAGVTKVWVFDPDDPQGGVPGQTIIYFIRGNDDDIIPSGSEVQTVKDLMDDEQKPAHMASADLIVNAPTPVSTDFIFTAISPDTAAMRQAIEDNLDAMMKNETEVGEPLTEDKYRATIQNTFDTQSGEELDTFTLSTPTGDIGGGAGELPTLGNVSF